LGRGAEPHTHQFIPENLAAVNSAKQVAYPPFLVYLPAGKKVR